ncbi:predicted protein [Naegleria gruberi]|uniref:Predicted protein n=1 Tax=Naegleria gruberi TaxID=5762 RepID=D2VLG0_NAEGR|nr:uncharacterized protein NAEGRDRAFT_80440 [Naegleria gruberi]EFC42379.1 predicted protein [Naegleria gruberi]|eukprot:XP_002675123.1 predicted protein [Naegleria gruberi strain NEG-M]
MLRLFLFIFITLIQLSNNFLMGIEEEPFTLSPQLNVFPQASGSYSTLFFDSSSMKLYSFGGFDGNNPLDNIQSSNVSISSKITSQLINGGYSNYSQITLDTVGPFSVIGKLPQKAYGYAFQVLNLNGIDYAYIFGGGTSKIMRAKLSDLQSFSVLDEELPYSCTMPVFFRTEKNLFLIGGSFNSEYSKAVYMANLSSPTIWQRVGTFPNAIFAASVFSVGRMIYIVGGGSDLLNYYKTIYYTSFDQLDSLTTSNASSNSVWKLSPISLPNSVFGSASFISANYAYIFSGSLGRSMLRANLNNMSIWENVTSFNSPYSAYGISVLNMGNSLLFAGGGPTLSSTIPYGYLMTISGFMNCYGVPSNDSNVCYGNGKCTGLNQCSCKNGFYGDACQYESQCYGIKASSLIVCSGNGDCQVGGNCSCFEGFSGVTCNDYECGGVSVLLLDTGKSLICSGRGSCISPGNCSCQLGYYGTTCENFDCYEIPYNNEKVCSGFGSCVAPNNCLCAEESGRVGTQCDLFQCYGKFSNDSLVCSGFGQCTGPDHCECLTGYSGEQCNSYKCQPNSIIPQCMKRGTCTKELKCSCQDGYYGDSCELYSCWGIANTDSNACSGNGVCSNIDTCECKKTENGTFYGSLCDSYVDSSRVAANLEIALNGSNVNGSEGLISFKIGSSIQSGLVSYRVWCSNCTDYMYNSYENAWIVESQEFSLDVSSLKREYYYEFLIRGVLSERYSQDILLNTLSTVLFIPKKLIQPQDVLITNVQTYKLSSTMAFTKNLDISILINRVSFNYPEGVDFLLNDCVGFSLDNTTCQLNYQSTITVFNSSDFKTPIRILENSGPILAQRYRDDSTIQLNPILQMNISNPFPNMNLDAFDDGSEFVFQISVTILSIRYSFQSFEKSRISIIITKPAIYPEDYFNRIELSPKEGMAVVDSFFVSSPEWIVNNLNLRPLSYAFGFYNKYQDKSTNGIPSTSSLIRVTEYSTEPVSKLPLPYLFKSLSRNSWSTSPIDIVIFVKDSEGFEQSLRVATAQVNPLSKELEYLSDYSKHVLLFDQSALSNTNNTNLILNLINNLNIDITNADSSLKVLNSISSESSIMKDKKVLNQLSNSVNSFLYNTLDLYQKEIDSYGYVKSSLTQDAKLTASSLLANIFGSSSSSITISQKGMMLVDDEMRKTENLILSFTKLMLKSEIPKVLSTDSDVTNLPYTKFSTSGLNTTFSSFVLTRGARSLQNLAQNSTKFLLETNGGNIQLDLREIAGKYGGFGTNLGLSLITYERNIRNDNFSMQNQMSSFIQELKYFQNAEVVKLI